MITIRLATASDGPALREIELQAGEQFRTVGYAFVADHPPFGLDVLAAYAEAGRSFVAVDDHGDPVGYLLVEVLDGNAHIEQVSVLPQRQGEGIGRALIDRAGTWARAAGLPATTLTTFRDVAWNAPLYAHLGFVPLDDGDVGPELRARVEVESAEGLDPATRVCMRRDESRGGPAS